MFRVTPDMPREMTPEVQAVVEAAELKALACLGRGYSTATHWVARACGFGKDTAKGRRLLRRMQRRGLVQDITAYRGDRVYWWRITASGLAALHAANGGRWTPPEER